MTQSSSTIITPLRKVTEYIVSHSAHFQKVEEQQYSPYHTTQDIKYMIPEPDYYHSSSQLKQKQKQQNQNVYLPQPLY